MNSQQVHSSPHTPPQNSVTRLMLAVVFAMLPGCMTYVYFFGWGLVINIVLAIFVALATEAGMLRLRQRPVMPFLTDGSAVVTAMLLALALPTLAPWWLTIVGVTFAIVIAKHLYGGLGYNPFNPAMVGYAVLLIAFPREMTAWLPAEIHHMGFMDSLRYTLFETLPAGTTFDTLTAATPLDTVKTELGLDHTLDEIFTSHAGLFGGVAGRGWEWINLMFMLGGLVLIYMKVINWRIPLALLGTLFIIATLFALPAPDIRPSPWFHLFGGAAMLGAFFIATDPVTAATTPRGQLIYGAGIGILIYVIRTWGGYPDAVAFAVLLMNMATPTIDYYTQPRVFGHEED
ncbi:MAG: electron transport complex subunit RsxD [Proteobacteria bacterium]|nr:electron transport complex subunit RsxD [Pseudomonadota bacterium]MCG6936200.1 electron transport complex subunit RsxD [Pseudomonadota bacterium]